MKVWIGRMLLAAAPFLLFGGLFECVLRRQVPISGVTPFQASPDQELPHELRPSFSTLYKGHQIRINSLGFRGPEFPERIDGVPRIALVGDSVTFGDAIGWEDTLGVQLQTALSARGLEVQVLNCGTPGYDAGDVARTTRTRVLPLEPDLVVYVFVCNDVDPSRHIDSIPPDAVIDPFARYPLRSALLQFLGVRVKGLLRSLTRSNTSSGWVANVQSQLENGGEERLEQALRSLRSACAERSAPLVVASYPFLVSRDRNPFEEIERCFQQLCEQLEVPWLDLVQAFPDGNLGAYWVCPFDSHPNGAAQAMVANFLASQLRPRLER